MWKAEVIADSTGKWCGNQLRFKTREEAEAYVSDLALRWTAECVTRALSSAAKRRASDMMTLQELFDMAAKRAAKIFEVLGEMQPILHAISKDSNQIIVPLLWTDQASKLRCLAQLKRALPAFGVQAYVVVSEAWTVTAYSPQGMLDVLKQSACEGLSEHPDRREVLTISAADKHGRRISGYYYILRPEHGSPKLSPLKTCNDIDGDFLDLLEGV